MELRDYQIDILNQLKESTTNDLVPLDTGAGKTPIEAAIAESSKCCLLIAHRNILITQISEKLAQFKIKHDTISSEATRRRCIAKHKKLGDVFIDRDNQNMLVASIASLVSMYEKKILKINTLKKWTIVIDEAHHVTSENQWGRVREILPNSRIIGFTATPARMDGQSLHIKNGGLFDRLVQADFLKGNSVEKLINLGYLSDFKVFAPSFDDSKYKNIQSLNWDVGELDLYAHPVFEYKKHAMGARAIMMCPSIKNAKKFSEEFKKNKISSACISSTHSAIHISRTLDAFEKGDIKVLTNVDMIGEGFDLPACETLIIATKTASFPRFRQWCGRILRPSKNKEYATIIDLTRMCVGGHGLPDDDIKWDLLNPPISPAHIKTIECVKCGYNYSFAKLKCSECGHNNEYHDLSKKFKCGSYEFDIRILDQKLVEQTIKKRNDELKINKKNNELSNPVFFGLDTVGKTIASIIDMFRNHLLKNDISIFDINSFFEMKKTHDKFFWIKHFNVKDLEKNDDKKSMEFYRKCLKSQ